MDCLFCNIVSGKVPAAIIYADDDVLAFNDIAPQAPIHKLIIPRKHITTLNDITGEDTQLVGHMVHIAKSLANDMDIAKAGYRLVFNCNQDGGQAVYHIHMHLLGGREMQWPPG